MVPEPDIQGEGGYYSTEYAFGRGKLKIEVSRIKDTSSGSTMAEWDFRIIPPAASDIEPIKYLDYFNMAASRTRDATARDLAKITNGFLPDATWRGIIERTYNEVVRKHRAGTPAIDLVDYELTSSEATYLVNPLIEDGQATLFYGDGKQGKSMFAALACYLVLRGREHVDLRATQGRVLWLDWETDAATTKRRLLEIAAGFDEDLPRGFIYRRMNQTLAADYMRIRRDVTVHKPSLIIADSAIPASGEPESAAETGRYFNTMSALGVTSVTIGHIPRTGTDPFGSVVWRNQARASYRFFAEKGDDWMKVGIKNKYINNGPQQPDRGYQFDFEKGLVKVSRCNPTEIEDLEAAGKVSDRIERVLKSGALKPVQIAAKLGIKADNVRKPLARMLEKGQLMQLPTGEYELAA